MAIKLRQVGRAAVLKGVALSGCSPLPEMAPNTVPAVSYDGQYSGTVALTGVASGADRSWCEVSSLFAVDVVDNGFSYSYSLLNLAKLSNTGPVRYSVTVARDGSFQGQSNSTGIMQGRIENGAMTGYIDGIGCAYRFTAQRG